MMRGGRQTRANRGSTKNQKNFALVPSVQTPRSVFNRSCGIKTAFNAGDLIPIFVDEALPGDTMAMKMALFGRMATPLYPVLDNMYADVFFFAVPNRLLWDKWQRLMGEQPNPGDSTDFLVPTINETVLIESISDYMGLPIGVNSTFTALHHRAYNLIFNEWFRDENLVPASTVLTDDGPDPANTYKILKRGKRHDYFSSCLPWPQKGAAVELPLGQSAPVVGTGTLGITGAPTFDEVGGTGGGRLGSYSGAGTTVGIENAFSGGNNPADWLSPGLNVDADAGGMTADLTAATAATINQIREAFQVQRLFERDARGGTRYTELLRSHFGVISPDQRLQRPEFLGGGTTKINVNPVPSTNRFSGENEIGDLGAFVTFSGNEMGFFKSFVEHCVVLGLVCIRADLNYQQGINKMFSRRTRVDFYWPSLAHLGEQAVLSKEIYADGTGDEEAGTGDFSVFGYQERFAEYRYKPSQITGRLRSTAAQPLDQWHLAQKFDTRPVLNETFIQENPPVDRVLAVTSGQPQFLFDGWFQYRCARPMPTYGVPGLIDHF